MTKVSIPGFIHARPAESWQSGVDVIDGHKFEFFTFDDLSSSGYVMVAPTTIDFDMPEGWDPRAMQIDALKKRREELTREFSESVMRIDQQISQLQAIEFAA